MQVQAAPRTTAPGDPRTTVLEDHAMADPVGLCTMALVAPCMTVPGGQRMRVLEDHAMADPVGRFMLAPVDLVRQ